MECARARAGRLPARRVAAEHRTALLQLSHHGGTGDDLHRDDGRGGDAALAREAFRGALDVVDSSARPAVPLHCQHSRVDDGRTGPAAVAGLWINANGGRIFEDGFGGEWNVYAVGILGHVHGAWDSVFVSSAPGN